MPASTSLAAAASNESTQSAVRSVGVDDGEVTSSSVEPPRKMPPPVEGHRDDTGTSAELTFNDEHELVDFFSDDRRLGSASAHTHAVLRADEVADLDSRH